MVVLEIRRRSMGLCVLHHVIKTTKHLVAFGNNTLVWFLIKKQSVYVFLTVNDGRCMYLSSVLSKCIVTPRGVCKIDHELPLCFHSSSDGPCPFSDPNSSTFPTRGRWLTEHAEPSARCEWIPCGNHRSLCTGIDAASSRCCWRFVSDAEAYR